MPTFLKNILPLTILFLFSGVSAQNVSVDGAILLKAKISLGNQNQLLKIGAYGFGILNFNGLSLESGATLDAFPFLKRHTKKEKGIGYSYEFYTLVGGGSNRNLLGSSVSTLNTETFINESEKSEFKGFGFGVRKDFLPGSLNLRVGNLFLGQGTDYATTGDLTVAFTRATNNEVYQIGGTLELFTPRPDYGRPPRNPRNSDDGRKNVWYTLPPHKDLFYGNVYGFASIQRDNYTAKGKLGIDSKKLGAYVQNKIHDGFGLNPRFPWDVSKKDKLFIELEGSYFLNEISND